MRHAWIWVIVAVVFIPGYSSRAEGVKFNSFLLETGPQVDDIVSFDVNDDGLKDIVIQEDHDLKIFLVRKDGVSVKPDSTIRMAGNSFLWTFGNLAGKGNSLVIATSDGMVCHLSSGGGFAKESVDLVVHGNIFEGISTSPPRNSDFLPDINGDGLSDAIIFDRNRLMVFIQNAKMEFVLRQKLDVPMESALDMAAGPHEKIEDIFSVPLMTFGDMNGDGRMDISYFQNQNIALFPQESDGTFRRTGVKKFELAGNKKRRRHYINIELPPKITDIDGDGMPDIMTIEPSKGRVSIFYARRGKADFKIPDDIKNVDGWSAGAWLRDINNDGRKDMILTEINKVGIIDGLKTFLSKKVSIHLVFFPTQPDGRLSAEPVRRLTFSIPFVIQFTLDHGVLDLVFRPNFNGDYNGDGYKDLLIKSGDRSLDVYLGESDGGVTSEPKMTIAMTPPAGVDRSDPFIFELNGDGVSDIILRHFDINKQQHRVEVLISSR